MLSNLEHLWQNFLDLRMYKMCHNITIVNQWLVLNWYLNLFILLKAWKPEYSYN